VIEAARMQAGDEGWQPDAQDKALAAWDNL
jgi:hypothetical protein